VRRSIKIALAMAVAAMISMGSLAVAGAGAAVAASKALPRATAKQVILDWTPARTPAEVHALQSAPQTKKTIQTFKTTVDDGGTTFTYKMIGKNPFKAVANPSTTIATTLIPVIVEYDGYTWDPTAVTSCDTSSAMTRTENSPLFNAQAWSFGPKSVGTHQYEDAFQRAEFYKESKPKGINPDYNVNLSVTVHAPLTLNVPSGDYAIEYSDGCGNDVLGEVDIDYLDSQLQSYITGTLGSAAATTFPLFVTNNVVAYEDGDGTDCCVLGYHSDMTNAGNFQVYGIADYDNSGDFGSTTTTAGMSHEVAEAVNDPDTVNPTKPWGNVGQDAGGECQNNLEVGDPLTGSVFTDTLNGFTYSLQELAFFSWFYHSSPSLGINGWYSDQDTFTTSAAACPPGGP
jgi:hypothetical protein